MFAAMAYDGTYVWSVMQSNVHSSADPVAINEALAAN